MPTKAKVKYSELLHKLKSQPSEPRDKKKLEKPVAEELKLKGLGGGNFSKIQKI